MNAPEAAPAPQGQDLAVDSQHPWLGLASFTEETRAWFHGREEEVGELSRRVQRKLLTVLFGQSGLGKTSILRAGIVPRLRPEGYCPVYVRIDYSPESPTPTEQIKQAIFRATEAMGDWTQSGVAQAGESLWEFLHHRDDILKDANGKTVIPLLIFDQFEEIFTLAQADDAGRQRAAQFIEDLADLVENRPPKALEARLEDDDTVSDRFDFGRADYRILIALREDYLAHLESVKGVMPSITQNRMRLAPMTGQQALAAVMKPGGKLVSQEVAESIVRFIAGGSELANAEVEPSLLSLICRELNNARIARGKSEISADLLAGSHDTILKEFYERALADQPAGVRRVIEEELLTESGYRENLAEESLAKRFADAGAAPDAIPTLVNRRLLRIEERLDIRRVELTHDVLCGVVKASRNDRLAREAKEPAEKQLAEQQARVARTRAALVRARQIAFGASVLAVVAVASAIWGFISTDRAQKAEAKALETRKQAESARTEAEKLVVFLLDDFQLELEPIGRLDLIAKLSKRALDYYAGLPAELKSPASERNRALAEVRYAISLRNLGQLDDALKAADDAIAVLGKLREGGDDSEVTLIGLAMGTSARARILNQQGRFQDSTATSTKAFDLIRPAGTKDGASVAARRALGEIAVGHGFNVMRDSNYDPAVSIFEVARTALRSIDDLQLGELTAAAMYVEATAWMSQAHRFGGRHKEAARVGREAMPVADGILAKQPGHMQGLRARALLASNLSDLDGQEFRLRTAIVANDASTRDYQALLKIDAGNTITWNNLGAQLMIRGLMEELAGRPKDAVRFVREAARTGEKGGMTAVRANNMADVWNHVSRLEFELGNRPASEAARAEALRFHRLSYKDAPPESFRFRLQSSRDLMFEAFPLFAAERHAEARDKFLEAIRRFGELKPENEGQRRAVAYNSVDAYSALAQVSLSLKDYAAAESHARRAVEIRESLPERHRWDMLWLQEARCLLAIALGRQGRLVDARAALAPAEKYLASMPDAREAPWINRFLAQAAYARAIADPAQARAHLDKAAALMDAMPPELRRTNSMTIMRNEIALEQAARR
jgi:tetratricopeptide (TPR) repeat protein